MALETFFGTADQKALLRKGFCAHQLFSDQPHFTYYGRTVGITSLSDEPLETLIALARLQGNSSLATLTQDEAITVVPAVEAKGLSANIFASWASKANCLENARALLSKRKLPKELSLEWLTPSSSNETRQNLADLALSVGVLPPNLAVLTGEVKPGVCAMALYKDGQVVSCAAAAMYRNQEPEGSKKQAWWGMLSTRRDQRGRGLSVILGAAVMVEMASRYGYTDFFTGVTPGNTPSEAVCARMGLFDEGTLILSAVDPTLMPGGRMTK